MSLNYSQWNPYNYCYNRPANLIDPTGMSAGDYYSQKGVFLGRDENPNDNKYYVVTDSKEQLMISETHKAGGITSLTMVSSAYQLPSAYVRSEMRKAVERAGSPSFHEEGRLFGVRSDDNSDYVVHAEAGMDADPLKDAFASINVFKAADPSNIPGGTIEGTFHTHPDGIKIGQIDFSVIGQTKSGRFNNEPSDFINENNQRVGIYL